jgi:hypothetical protein
LMNYSSDAIESCIRRNWWGAIAFVCVCGGGKCRESVGNSRQPESFGMTCRWKIK